MSVKFAEPPLQNGIKHYHAKKFTKPNSKSKDVDIGHTQKMKVGFQ